MSQNSTQIPEQYAPIRVIKTTHGSISGTYMFNNEPVKFESTLERDYLIRLSTFDYISNIVSQPLTVKFLGSNGLEYSYTPDFLVNFKGYPYPFRKSELIEIKPHSKLKKNIQKWKPKFRAAIRCCNDLNYVYHIKDESRIRDQRWNNAMFLRRYKKMNFDNEESNWITANLKKAGVMTFDQLLKRHFLSKDSQATGISHIWHLVSTQILSCDLSVPFSIHTELWVKNES